MRQARSWALSLIQHLPPRDETFTFRGALL
jgi:hypothetical protein